MPSRSGNRGRGFARSAWAPAVVHLGARAVALAAVMVALAIHPLHTGGLGGDLGAALGKSDGVWYLGIAHHGYGPPPPIGPDGTYTHLTSLAFFPLYPLLIRAVALLGVPFLGAALLVTAIAGALAATAIAAWARPLLGRDGALALVVGWELFPSSIVLGMAYSEALFVAAAASCLLALQRRSWLAAGGAAAIGGLTRPTGGCLVLAIAVAAIAASRSRDGDDPTGPSWWWRPLTAVGLGLAGLAASLVHVAVATGRIDGWFWLERTVWNSGFDAGWSALQHFGELVTGGRTAHRLPEIVAAVAVVGAVVLAVGLWRSARATAAADPAYAVAAAVLAVGERGYFYVKPRLLFVAFPLLAPLFGWYAAQQRRRRWAIAVAAGTLSACYNAYLLVGWPKAL